MKNFSLSLLLGAASGVKLGHFVPDIPTLWVRHVDGEHQCDGLNRTAAI